MSTEKLSELSKPVGFAREEDIKLMQSGKLLSGLTIWRSGKEPLYSQEYVSALLEELGAKNERIGWLEAIATDYVGKFQKAQDALKYAAIMSDEDKKKISGLEAKLATPVRLPDDLEPNTEPCVICGVVSSHPEGWHYCHPKCGEGDA